MANQHIAIPVILKVGKGTLGNLGTYLRENGLKNVVLYFGDGLIELFGVTVMKGMETAGVDILEYREINTTKIDDLVEIAFSIDNRAQAVIGLGGEKSLTLQNMPRFCANCRLSACRPLHQVTVFPVRAHRFWWRAGARRFRRVLLMALS